MALKTREIIKIKGRKDKLCITGAKKRELDKKKEQRD